MYDLLFRGCVKKFFLRWWSQTLFALRSTKRARHSKVSFSNYDWLLFQRRKGSSPLSEGEPGQGLLDSHHSLLELSVITKRMLKFMDLGDRAAVLEQALGKGVILALDAIILSLPDRDIERARSRLLAYRTALLDGRADRCRPVHWGALPVRDVNQFIQQYLISPVHARVHLIFTEVFILSLKGVVVFDSSGLSLNGFFKSSMPLDFPQLLLVIIIACCSILQNVGVILYVSRGLHF